MFSLSKVSQGYIRLTRLHTFPLGALVVFAPAGTYRFCELWRHSLIELLALGTAMAAYTFTTPAEDFASCIVIHFVACTLGHSTFCILNDITDRDLDALVGERLNNRRNSGVLTIRIITERTKSRPIASGVVPLSGARVLFLVLLLLTTYSFSLLNSHAFVCQCCCHLPFSLCLQVHLRGFVLPFTHGVPPFKAMDVVAPGLVRFVHSL